MPHSRTMPGSRRTVLIGIASICLNESGGSIPATAQTTSTSVKQVKFSDMFDRDDLGPAYEIDSPDMDRLVVGDGTLIIVGTSPPNNLVNLRQPIKGDFVARIALKMEVAAGNVAGLAYSSGPDNGVFVGVSGVKFGKRVPFSDTVDFQYADRRQPFFVKIVNGRLDDSILAIPALGNRALAGFSELPEMWYFQLQREGSKYTGSISVDGLKWVRLGTHVIVQSDGRLGIRASSGGGFENPAEFSSFVVQG